MKCEDKVTNRLMASVSYSSKLKQKTLKSKKWEEKETGLISNQDFGGVLTEGSKPYKSCWLALRKGEEKLTFQAFGLTPSLLYRTVSSLSTFKETVGFNETQ